MKFTGGVILIIAAISHYAGILVNLNSWKEYPLGAEIGLIPVVLLGGWMIKTSWNKKTE